MRSRVYAGRIMHERFLPRPHRFAYPAYIYAVDLDELPDLDGSVPGFGYNRFALASIRDRDYLRGEGTIKAKLLRHLERNGGADGVARVELVTMPRFLGYAFNPVSFYYCYDHGDRPICVVTEVNNTFGETHLYILRDAIDGAGRFPLRYRHPKQFHVSPFNDMRGSYDFSFSELNGRLRIRVDLYRDDAKVLAAAISGNPAPLTGRTLWRTALRYPLAAALTVPRIVWQAARLYAQRRLPVFRKPPPAHPLTIGIARPGRLQRFAMRRTFALLGRIRKGCLTVQLPDCAARTFGDPASDRCATMHVREYRAFTRILFGGDIGLGESFCDGDWDTDDLTGFIRLLIDNVSEIGRRGVKAPSALGVMNRLRHLRRANTVAGSKANIHAHYDLGNDLYSQFLDAETMMYSSGLYVGAAMSLEAAQAAKIDRLIELADLRPEHHVLEIGCGWGGFAVAAARQTGCRVTAITLSEEQLAFASRRVAEAGLQDRVEIRLEDYRRIRGQYDRIVSIEMLEAVGHRYYGTFFGACDRLLAPGGRVVIQVITIPDQRYERYRRSPDWIQKHIFPGGMLPCLNALSTAMMHGSSFVVEHLDNIGPHYAPTLREWRRRFDAAEADLDALGYDEAFRRKWRYYLSYCEAAFDARYIGNLHLVLARPNDR